MENNRKVKRWVVSFGIINFLLLSGILASVLLFWKPWDQSATITDSTRKIIITGTSTIKAEPDEYQFNPSYTKDTTDEITKLNDQLIKTLKNLGVKDDQIKNNASRYGSTEIYYIVQPTKGKEQTTLSLTITVDSKDLAQKVQDYLVTTNPSGSITPYASFSTEKQNALQDQARGEAIKDARKKAEQTASGLGLKIGKVISISEGASGGGCGGAGTVCPVAMGMDSSKGAPEDSSLSVQPGTDEFSYSFTVVFALAD